MTLAPTDGISLGVEERGSPRAMKKLDLVLRSLSGPRECRGSSDPGGEVGVRQGDEGTERGRPAWEGSRLKSWAEGTDPRVF